MKYILFSEGTYIAENSYEYHIKDHLGNVRVAFFDNDTIVQRNDYYPFGMSIAENSYQKLAGNYKNTYLYNGKEFQEDLGLGWLDYGARFYDAQVGRWWSIDPLAEVAYGWTPYRFGYNNPIKYNDPSGMLESTHTDEDGNVIAVYDDGDKGVYKHEGNAKEAKKHINKNYKKNNTSAGGKKMGESLHELSFADQNLYNKSNIVKHANIKIDFGSSELTDKVQQIIDVAPTLKEYAAIAGTNGDWDLKSNTKNGSKLFGKYASPRDAGNFAAGAVAQMSYFTGIAQFGYGAYNLTGNSKPLTGLLTLTTLQLKIFLPSIGNLASEIISKYGEDYLTQRSIDIGKNYIKNK